MNKIFSVFGVSVFCMMLCHGAVPENWLSNHQRAQALSKTRKMPIMILFAGSECENSATYKNKLANSPEISAFIGNNFVPLYVELPPGSTWSADFKRALRATYPFLQVDYGVALPAIYFTDGDFNDLKIREPRFSIAGFTKAARQSREAIEARAAASPEAELIPAAATEKKKPSTAEPAAAKPKYTSRDQMREANRQKRANQDPTGDPPVGWFTDPEKAKEFAAARNLPIMLLFSGTDWCGPCKHLRKNVLDTQDVQQLVVSKCVALYVHVPRGGWNMVRKKYPFWQGRGVPGFVFTDAKFRVIKSAPTRVGRSLSGFANAIREATAGLK